ncbi:MAG: AMP-binding protein, partial [Candidatus Rokuibacteriota bacterium]
MQGLMMDYPLTLTHFFERSRRLFARKPLATRVPGRPLFRYTYADFAERTARLAGVLAGLGVGKGDRVGTFAWNSHRHLELYWAAPLSGAVLHTVNVRLSAPDRAYIINHAGDAVLFVDASLWPLVAEVRGALRMVRHVVVMPDGAAPVPAGVPEYEDLLAAARPVEAWPRLDEGDAAG